MFIELDSIFNNIGSSREVDYSFLIDGEENVPDPVKVKGRIENRAGVVSFSGKVFYALSSECDRCAQPFTRDMSFDFEHTLVTSLNEDDNDDYILVEDLRLDIDELIREDVILSFPTQFLCREDCKGLCHICGQNLNDKQCGCKEPVDPRLAVLMQLLEDDN